MVPVNYDLLYRDGLVTCGPHSMVVLKVHQGCDDHLSPFNCSKCLVQTITVITGSVICSPKTTQWTYARMMGNGKSGWKLEMCSLYGFSGCRRNRFHRLIVYSKVPPIIFVSHIYWNLLLFRINFTIFLSMTGSNFMFITFYHYPSKPDRTHLLHFTSHFYL